jgi:hypothetical protein
MRQRKQATAQQAQAVVEALLDVFEQPLFEWERPRVIANTPSTLVVWEEGPHGWMSVFPCGGMLSGTSWEIPAATMPDGVWVEPHDGCVVSVYQEAWMPCLELPVEIERTPLGDCWTNGSPSPYSLTPPR